MDKDKIPPLSVSEKERFERDLSDPDPVSALRRFAMETSSSGLGQRSVYLKFLAFYKELQSSGRDKEEAILGDVMDMITDTFSPHNLNLPK